MNTKLVCAHCVHFIGGGDWNLCCAKPPKDKVGWLGFLCYEDTPACENFELKQTCSDGLISNFDYLARVFGIHAFNESGERILADDEIVELILPYYLEVDPICQLAICTGLVGFRKANEFYAKIQELKDKKEKTNATLDR